MHAVRPGNFQRFFGFTQRKEKTEYKQEASKTVIKNRKSNGRVSVYIGSVTLLPPSMNETTKPYQEDHFHAIQY